MRTMRTILVCLLAVGGCGGGGGDGDDGDDAPPPTDGGQPTDMLDTAVGCAGVYNPDQVLDYAVEMAPADWDALRADTTNSVMFPASLTCGGGSPIDVGIRRKRSGGSQKVGLKIDINYFAPDQRYHGLNKLSLENGISEGSSGDGAEARDLAGEYMAWRFMVRSGAITGRAVIARFTINGEAGAYVNVEQVDKRFLQSRLAENDGWLYKKSGSPDDGFKTREGEPDPHAAYFCFWSIPACPTPSPDALLAELPDRLDIPQMLRVGAVNALIANNDAILLKDNNFYFYDNGTRYYLPWDLDTTMARPYDVYGGTVPGGTPMYIDVLYAHWASDYRAIVEQLLAGPFAVAAIGDELDRMVAVAGPAIDGDPLVTGTAAEAAEDLARFWSMQHAAVGGN